MLRLFLFVLMACFVTTSKAQSKPNTLSSNEKREGWTLLFDGKSASGWHKYGGKPVGAAWKVEDGMLFLDPTQKKDWQVLDGGDIVTGRSFTNFHLKLEWKISQNGNSGIMFYIHEDTTKYIWPWMSAPEMQVLDNQEHADSKIIKHRAGDLYDLISCKEETVRPFGEWNQVEIRCVNGQLDFWLNGVNVVSTKLWGEDWKKLIAGSKFANMNGFGTYQQGKFGLQDHGDMVWFRNIKVREL
jgi:hypothetical protein